MTDEIKQPNILIEQQRESIKIEKNSKSVNWEIRIMPRAECLLPSDIARLVELDNQCREIWGKTE